MNTKRTYGDLIEQLRKAEPRTENFELMWENIAGKISNNEQAEVSGDARKPVLPQTTTELRTYRLFRTGLIPVLAASVILLFFGLFSVLNVPTGKYGTDRPIVSPDKIKVRTYSEKMETCLKPGPTAAIRYKDLKQTFENKFQTRIKQ